MITAGDSPLDHFLRLYMASLDAVEDQERMRLADAAWELFDRLDPAERAIAAREIQIFPVYGDEYPKVG